MDRNVEDAVIDLKNYIENTKQYRKVIELKKKMEKSSNIMKLIEEIKNLQKEYVKNNNDEDIGKALKNLEKKLNEIPIYSEYNKNLEEINDIIYFVREELNSYFDKKINI